jgi:hypothetical protein
MKSIPTGSSLLQVRSNNLSVVFAAIRLLGLVSRIELAEYTQLTTSTITNLVNELLRWNLLIEAGSAASQGGRRRTMLSLNTCAGWVVTLAVHRTYIQGGLVNLGGQVGWRDRIDLDHTDEGQVKAIADSLYRSLVTKAIEQQWDIIGIGIAGVHSSETPWWRTYRPKDASPMLEVKTDYLVRAAVLAEAWYGCGKQHASLVYLDEEAMPHIGVTLGNTLYVGAHGQAGNLPFKHPLSVTESGLDERIAAMVSAAIYAFDPELVVIDSKTTPERVEKWRQWVSKYGMRATVAGSECNSQTRFCVSALGSDGPLIGAACMVLESFFTDPIGQLAKLSISPQWNLSQVVRN